MIETKQIKTGASAVLAFTGTAQGKSLGAVTFTNLTASSTIVISGNSNVTTAVDGTGDGYPLANGTLPAAGSQVGASVTFAPAIGDYWAVATGASVLAIAYSYVDG